MAHRGRGVMGTATEGTGTGMEAGIGATSRAAGHAASGGRRTRTAGRSREGSVTVTEGLPTMGSATATEETGRAVNAITTTTEGAGLACGARVRARAVPMVGRSGHRGLSEVRPLLEQELPAVWTSGLLASRLQIVIVTLLLRRLQLRFQAPKPQQNIHDPRPLLPPTMKMLPSTPLTGTTTGVTSIAETVRHASLALSSITRMATMPSRRPDTTATRKGRVRVAEQSPRARAHPRKTAIATGDSGCSRMTSQMPRQRL